MMSAPPSPDSITKLDYYLNIIPIQEEELATWGEGSIISFCNLNWEVLASIL